MAPGRAGAITPLLAKHAEQRAPPLVERQAQANSLYCLSKAAFVARRATAVAVEQLSQFVELAGITEAPAEGRRTPAPLLGYLLEDRVEIPHQPAPVLLAQRRLRQRAAQQAVGLASPEFVAEEECPNQR